jgi:hypothetical protein
MVCSGCGWVGFWGNCHDFRDGWVFAVSERNRWIVEVVLRWRVVLRRVVLLWLLMALPTA